jgi:hypothetical protein
MNLLTGRKIAATTPNTNDTLLGDQKAALDGLLTGQTLVENLGFIKFIIR